MCAASNPACGDGCACCWLPYWFGENGVANGSCDCGFEYSAIDEADAGGCW